MNVKAVGYIGINAPDPESWLRYGCDVMGMMPARAIPGEGWGTPQSGTQTNSSGIAADGSVFLKMDERQWRIAVHKSDAGNRLRYLGLELDDGAALDAAIAELSAAGITVRRGSAEEAIQRAVAAIAFTHDPCGNALELFYGPTTDYNFTSPIPGLEFVAGHLGIGHMNLFVNDLPASFDFYTRLLGFKLTDFIRMGPDNALNFMRCNARHHSIAIVDMGGINGLQHTMFELRTIDDVGKVLDRALAAGIQISSSLGRHRNDGMLSFYMQSPSGFDVEIGCDGILVDETWTTNEFCEGDVWGHAGLVDAVVRTSEDIRAHQGTES